MTVPPLISLTRASLRPSRPLFSSLYRLTESGRDGDTRFALLRDVTWSVHPREHHLVVGANGSGKSTLLSALSGRAGVVVGGDAWFSPEVAPVSKRVRLVGHASDGEWARRAREAEEAVGRPVLVREVVQRGEDHAGSVGDRVHVPVPDEVMHKRVTRLSPSETRLVTVAVAVGATPRPRVLLLDEAFNGVDESTRRVLREVLLRLARNEEPGHETQLVVATHRQEDAELLRDVITHKTVVGGGRVESRESVRGVFVSASHGASSLVSTSTLAGRGEEDVAGNVVKAVELSRALGAVRRQSNVARNLGNAWISLPALKTNVRGGSRVVVRHTDVESKLMDGVVHAYPQPDVLNGADANEKREVVAEASPHVQAVFASHHGMSAVDVGLRGFVGAVGPGTPRSLFSEEQKQAAAAWLDVFLPDWRTTVQFSSLSQGRQMATVLARAFVGGHPLLFLVDPHAGLDERVRRRLGHVLRAWSRAWGDDGALVVGVSDTPGFRVFVGSCALSSPSSDARTRDDEGGWSVVDLG